MSNVTEFFLHTVSICSLIMSFTFDSDGIWLKYTIAPALEAVEYETYTFQNKFTQMSIYRGPPTPEREAAWESLTHSKAI